MESLLFKNEDRTIAKLFIDMSTIPCRRPEEVARDVCDKFAWKFAKGEMSKRQYVVKVDLI